ncbi:MAG: M28 family peptidase [Saprospiraceae bacterium]
MKGNLGKIIVFALIAIMAIPYLMKFSGCSDNKKNIDNPTVSEPAETIKVDIPAYSVDTAFAFTAKQVAFGPRVPNSAAHKACRAWLVKKLKSYGAQVEEQELSEKHHSGKILKGANIIAKFNPQNPRRVMLAAHWDTREVADKDENPAKRNTPIDGADDGASGVGILLEIARTFKQKPIELGLDIVLFDLEDNGKDGDGTEDTEATWCLGSQHWAKNKGNYQARFGILLDMVGAKNATFPKEGYSMHYAPEITNKIWSIASRLGHSRFFVNDTGGGITDDHVYVNKSGIPMVDIINLSPGPSGSFGFYHHTHDDNMNVIDKETMNAVLETVLIVVFSESAAIL